LKEKTACDGGFFANGAMTASFAYVVTAGAQAAQKDPGRPLA